MIKITSPQTRDEFKAYYELRYKILREPWGMQKGTEKDDYEPLSRHFMAVDDANGKVVGVIKLMEREPGTGWFSHMAVHENYQKKGVGRLLLTHVESEAKKMGFTILGCMARLNTTDYFERVGYAINGLPAQYLGTTQVVWMEKKI